MATGDLQPARRRRSLIDIGRALVVAANVGLAVYALFLGSLLLIGGTFVGVHIVLAGVVFLAYSVAGFLIAKQVYDYWTATTLWFDLAWVAIGMSYLGTAAINEIQHPQVFGGLGILAILASIEIVSWCGACILFLSRHRT